MRAGPRPRRARRSPRHRPPRMVPRSWPCAPVAACGWSDSPRAALWPCHPQRRSSCSPRRSQRPGKSSRPSASVWFSRTAKPDAGTDGEIPSQALEAEPIPAAAVGAQRGHRAATGGQDSQPGIPALICMAAEAWETVMDQDRVAGPPPRSLLRLFTAERGFHVAPARSRLGRRAEEDRRVAA
jgi:hypothetical protein